MRGIRVPNNEPGLVNPRRNEDGTLNEADLAELRAVYQFIGRTPARIVRWQEQAAAENPDTFSEEALPSTENGTYTAT